MFTVESCAWCFNPHLKFNQQPQSDICIHTQMVKDECKHMHTSMRPTERKECRHTWTWTHTHTYTQAHVNVMDTLLDKWQTICAFLLVWLSVGISLSQCIYCATTIHQLYSVATLKAHELEVYIFCICPYAKQCLTWTRLYIKPQTGCIRVKWQLYHFIWFPKCKSNIKNLIMLGRCQILYYLDTISTVPQVKCK